MTKEQIIQAVLKKATEANCDWHNDADIHTVLSALYDCCKNELGEERFSFYARHHRLTDLLYKLQNRILSVDQLNQLDTFSLENDRTLPRLLQADEHELSSSAAEIAEYDLYEYNPRHHPYTRATNDKDPSEPDFVKYQKKNKVAQEFLAFVFDEIMMPMAEQRARLYKTLRPLHEALQKHKKRAEELAIDPSLAHWTMSMLPSTTEQDYVNSQIETLSGSVQLLQDKISLFSAIIDRSCYELRLVEKGKKQLNNLYLDISLMLKEYTGSRGYFEPHLSKKIIVSNAYLMEKFPEQMKEPLPVNRLTPTGRTTHSEEYNLSLTKQYYKDANRICVYRKEDTTWEARVFLKDQQQFVECPLTLNAKLQSELAKIEAKPEQEGWFKGIREPVELVKTILQATTDANATHCTEKTEGKFSIFKLETSTLLEKSHHGFYEFMRGLAGTVLAPLRALFYKCAPECLQKQAFYRTQSRHCLYRTHDKLVAKMMDMDKDYPASEPGGERGLTHPDVLLDITEEPYDHTRRLGKSR